MYDSSYILMTRMMRFDVPVTVDDSRIVLGCRKGWCWHPLAAARPFRRCLRDIVLGRGKRPGVPSSTLHLVRRGLRSSRNLNGKILRVVVYDHRCRLRLERCMLWQWFLTDIGSTLLLGNSLLNPRRRLLWWSTVGEIKLGEIVVKRHVP